MSEEKKEKDKKDEKSDETDRKTPITYPGIAALAAIEKQSKMLQEVMQRVNSNAMSSGLMQIAETLRIANESTMESMRRIHLTVTAQMIPPELLARLNEASKSFELTRNSMATISMPNYLINPEAFEEDIVPGLHATIRTLSSQILTLEEIIKEKDERISQLEQMLDDRKKKKPDSSIV